MSTKTGIAATTFSSRRYLRLYSSFLDNPNIHTNYQKPQHLSIINPQYDENSVMS